MRRKSLTAFVRKPPKAHLPWCQWCGTLGEYIPDMYLGKYRSSLDCCENCLPGPPTAYYYMRAGEHFRGRGRDAAVHTVYLQAIRPLQ